MSTINRTFSVRNGIDVANTVIVTNTSGIINVSNIQLMNTVNLNVSNLASIGNLFVTTLNVSTLNISSSENVTGTINATVNVSAAGLVLSGNAGVGNIAVTQNGSFGNISTSNISVSANIANAGNILVTQNITTGNISTTQNGSFGNISAVTGTFSGAVSITGNLIVAGNTITLNASTVQTNDQYIIVASNNYADVLDYGFAGQSKNATQANVYSGLVRHASDETWHLFEGYTLMNAYPASINTAQTNVATLNANVIAQQITLGTSGLNVESNLYAAANTVAVWNNGVKSQDHSNLMFLSTGTINTAISTNGVTQVNISMAANANAISGFITTANASNILITYSSTGATIDTRLSASGGGGAVNVFANSGSVVQAVDNVVFLNSASVLWSVTQNASETHGANITPSVNATLNLTSLNVSANISNTGNLLVSQNIYAGNVNAWGNIQSISGTNLMNISSGLVQSNATNLVIQTISSSNQNVVLSANGTANATLSNTGNLTLSSGNLVTTYNVIAGNLSVTQNGSFGNISTANISVTSIANIATLNVSSAANVTGSINATANVYAGNLILNQNAAVGNISFVNAYAGNIITSGIIQSNAGNVTINTLAISVNSVTLATVSQTVLDNFVPLGTTSGFSTVEYTIAANCANALHATKILVLCDGTNVYMDEYSTLLGSGGAVGTFTTALTSGNVQLLFTANNATSTTVRTTRYGIQA